MNLTRQNRLHDFIWERIHAKTAIKISSNDQEPDQSAPNRLFNRLRLFIESFSDMSEE